MNLIYSRKTEQVFGGRVEIVTPEMSQHEIRRTSPQRKQGFNSPSLVPTCGLRHARIANLCGFGFAL